LGAAAAAHGDARRPHLNAPGPAHGPLGLHVEWALAAGGRLGAGNDPRYIKSRCFEAFPFASDDTGLAPALADRVRVLAERLDARPLTQPDIEAHVTARGRWRDRLPMILETLVALGRARVERDGAWRGSGG
jgi:hypothetical protein